MNSTYVIMGVSGSGKTTIGKLLATHLRLPFLDADDFHPKENIEKMTEGIPLNDTDRWPWLEQLRKQLTNQVSGAVLACSALKESYRNILSENNEVVFIYLEGDYDTIFERMKQRNHFMKPELLASQFKDLEPPTHAISVPINKTEEEILSEILDILEPVKSSQFGIVGMGVMGKSLAKNTLDKGFSISVYNRASDGEAHIIPNFIAESSSNQLQGFVSLDPFVASLEKPRKILLMVPAGAAVDYVIDQLTPLLEANDILIDGGNSHYRDSQRREALLSQHKINFLGVGISGGEEGALTGPSMMAGGNLQAYQEVASILEAIAAKDIHENPCVAHFGSDGAGHAIKTLHNGIEYGEMQLIAEVYALLKPHYELDEIATLLESWNTSELQSFLLETSIAILRKKETSEYLLPKVLDVAKAKGTGTWSVAIALELGIPATCMMAAVQARSISQYKAVRTKLSQTLSKDLFEAVIVTEAIKTAYQMARIINHYQGLQILNELSNKEGWDLDLSEIVRVWTRGCILQSKLLQDLQPLLKDNRNLLEVDTIVTLLGNSEKQLAEVLLSGQQQRTPLLCFAAAYQYWVGISTRESSANMIQAQRDAFGAHTYQRTDQPKEKTFTTNWKSND